MARSSDKTEFPNGFKHYPLYFAPSIQAQLIDEVARAVRTAPFFTPTMPKTGAPLSVVMSNFGPLGWVTDKEAGYRYQFSHPKTGAPWPAMPQILLELWKELTAYPAPPQACLINWYREGSKMGLHIDNDEQDLNAPVVSVSLGDPATFRMGGHQRGGATKPLKLYSGDVVVLAREARRCYHGVSKVFHGQSALVPKGGRINLTLRRVNR